MFRRLTLILFYVVTLMCDVVTGEIDYERDIRPLMTEKCASCHGVLQQQAGLRLDHGQLLRRGGDNGPVVDHQHPMESELLQRVTADDPALRMPPEDQGTPLSQQQIRLLSDWIAAGSPSPDDEAIPIGPDQHWAWQELTRPSLPAHEPHASSQNPIDVFIDAKQVEHGIVALPLADKRTRLRRLYFDLIGLPPTPQQQRSFLENTSSRAWSEVVHRLLGDPAHGERWARHWMDVWRYSDWYGYKDQVRGSQRHIWRWRDWIIESLNADKGYDQMVVEMLAGDELAPTDDDVLRATGFLARNYHNSNRNIWLDSTVEHTAKAFLGLTINCARCHDHKYDPLSQREYYAFRSIFEPHHVRTERLTGQPDSQQDGLVRVFDAKLDEPTFLFIAGNDKHPDTDHPVSPEVPAIFGSLLEIAPVALPDEAVFPSLQPFIEREDIAAAEKKSEDARRRLIEVKATFEEAAGNESESDDLDVGVAQLAAIAAQAEVAALKARWKADKLRYGSAFKSPPGNEMHAVAARAAVKAEHQAKVAQARLVMSQKKRALAAAERMEDESKRQDGVDKANKEVESARKQVELSLGEPKDDVEYTPVGEAYPQHSTGRRLALARWITRRDNPLTARVAVNYLWMHHFGDPLVANVFDFGLRSPEPVHRDLLDWLAVELIERDWSLKHLHQLITTSRAYQLASHPGDSNRWNKNHQLDPENRLLWRANTRRLDAEVIRDSLFFVAGNLDREHSGPDIDFSHGETVRRRSVYFRHAYEKQMTMLVLFDAAAPTECYRRSPSIIPQQALALANSALSFDQARSLAGQLVRSLDAAEQRDQTAFVRNAFQVLLSRECTDDELRVCTEFLARQTKLLANQMQLQLLKGTAHSQTIASPHADQRARENLIHTLLNHNDFVTIR